MVVSLVRIYIAACRIETAIVALAFEGTHLVFDMSLDGQAWTSCVTRERAAIAGEVWLGPQGLLDRLELELGLVGARETPLERTVDLVRQLETTSGFWSASVAIDPIATARRLLDDRDALMWWGWAGEPASSRLDALWDITTSAATGLPDRLRHIVAALDNRRPAIATLRHFEPIETLPALWQRLFRVLAAKGVPSTITPLPAVVAGGDLGGLRSGRLDARGDGTVQLVRSQGPLAAADDVAAAIAALSRLDEIVIITPDAILDRALLRHGLPCIGADVPPPASAVLIRLCIETAFHPMDPAALHALLVADPGPIPRGIAAGLAWALAKFPARGTSQWCEALTKNLAGFADDVRPDITTRITSLLDPIAPRAGAIELNQIIDRLRILATWARGRCSAEPSLREVALAANQFVELVRRRGRDRFQRRELLRLCDELDRVVVTGLPAQVGPIAVSDPGAVLAPARAIVWWGFTRDRVRRQRGPRLTREEGAALSSVGVLPPDTSAAMMNEARRWRRPLDLATDALVLVCPYEDAVGDRAHAHPLWDEIVASSSPEHAHRLRRARVTFPECGSPLEGRRERVTLRSTPKAFDAACTRLAISIEEAESVSRIEQLVGCSLTYVLRTIGKLRRRLPAPPSEPSPLLFGNLSHHILALAFARDGSWSAAEQLANTELAHLSEALLLPDHQAERVMLVRAIVASAKALQRLVESSGAKVRGVEMPLEGAIASLKIEGRADLILDEPAVVIDLKWGMSAHREHLRSGTAIQLAVYAALASAKGGAYLGVRDQRLFATRGSGLNNGTEPGVYAIDEVARAATVAIAERTKELKMGQLFAPGAIVDATRSRIEAGRIDLAPPCVHCELDGICGRRGRR